MMPTRTCRHNAAKLGLVLLVAGVSLFVVEGLSFRAIYGKYDNILVVCSEAGLVLSAAAFILTLFDRRTVRRVVVAIASLILGYLFVSSVAWSVMVK